MTTDQIIQNRAEQKATQRRAKRDSFPHPLDQIALRYVDSIAALEDRLKSILAKAVEKEGSSNIAAFIEILGNDDNQIRDENDLIDLMPETPIIEPEKYVSEVTENTHTIDPVDVDYLVKLLMKCYPDMPGVSADALARADVMGTSLRVVEGTRNAIHGAMSDFVVVTLYTLFEEKLHELSQIINGNPAFVKAIQLSRPDWK